uniref:Actin-related protein 2/3 complex subunit 3 n=1 Tax=Panagrellus redivivus TaxID=6233 RepID=A0A7E4UMR7_PANRE
LRKFRIEGQADTLVVYLYLYYIECCKILHGCERESEALNNIYAFAKHRNQPIPGSSRFPLNDLIGAPTNSRDEELVRNYLEQLRIESGERFVKAVFRNSKGASKYWTMFRKRRFINRILEVNK